MIKKLTKIIFINFALFICFFHFNSDTIFAKNSEVNVFFIGFSGSGKTTLINKTLNNTQDESIKYGSTTEVVCKLKVKESDKSNKILYKFYDIPGVLEIQRQMSFIAENSIIFVVINLEEQNFKSTLDKACKEWFTDVRKISSNNKFVLIGNKKDCISLEDLGYTENFLKIAQSFYGDENFDYILTSAENEDDVSKIFQKVETLTDLNMLKDVTYTACQYANCNNSFIPYTTGFKKYCSLKCFTKANTEKIYRDITSHSERLQTHDDKLYQHSNELDKHSRKLDEHADELYEHSNELDQHSHKLDEHTNKLYEHSKKLRDMSDDIDDLESEIRHRDYD